MVNLIKQCQFVKGPADVHRRGGGRSMRMDNSSTPLWTTFAQTIVPGMFSLSFKSYSKSFFTFFGALRNKVLSPYCDAACRRKFSKICLQVE